MATKKRGGKTKKRTTRVRQTYAAPFDTSEAAVAARAERREERLAALAPLGISNANYLNKAEMPAVLAATERAAAGAASRAECKALKEVSARLRSNSLRLTDNAKAIVRPFALADAIDVALSAS